MLSVYVPRGTLLERIPVERLDALVDAVVGALGLLPVLPRREQLLHAEWLALGRGTAGARGDDLVHGAALRGIERAALAALIRDSSGRSFGFEVAARLPTPAAFAIGAPLLVKDVGLLSAILPDHPGARLMCDTAAPFLTAATGKKLKD